VKSRSVCAAVAAGLTLAIVGPGELMASAPVGMRLSYEITASGTGGADREPRAERDRPLWLEAVLTGR